MEDGIIGPVLASIASIDFAAKEWNSFDPSLIEVTCLFIFKRGLSKATF